MYRGTSNKKLIASTYNGLGTNQTTACIRVQAGNARLIYDIAKTNRYSIPIRIYRSSNKGPFGKITLNDTTGKIPATRITIQQIRLLKTRGNSGESKTDEPAPVVICKNAPLSKSKLRSSSLEAVKRSIFAYYNWCGFVCLSIPLQISQHPRY